MRFFAPIIRKLSKMIALFPPLHRLSTLWNPIKLPETMYDLPLRRKSNIGVNCSDIFCTLLEARNWQKYEGPVLIIMWLIIKMTGILIVILDLCLLNLTIITVLFEVRPLNYTVYVVFARERSVLIKHFGLVS